MSAFVDRYLSWLKENMKETDVGGGIIEITTPFLDMNNDYTQFYIKKENELCRITDNGYTIDNLAMAGVEIFASERRAKILELFLKKLGLSVDKSTREIYLEFPDRSGEDIPLKGHCLLQGILDVNDMFCLVGANVVNLFVEEVSQFFKERKIYNTRNVSFRGKSGLIHQYDFLLQENELRPGRVVRLMNNPQKETFERYVFEWSDIQENIKDDGDVKKCIILINDLRKGETKKLQQIVEGFNIYGIETSFWSQRDKEIALFA